MASIHDCRLVQLQRVADRKGNITPIQSLVDVPFDIRRVFYLYDIPGGESRGAHAHKELHEFLVCIMGSFEVSVDDGHARDILHLDRSYRAIYIPPMIWSCYQNFSSGSICLAIASDIYKPDDYIRSYDEFLQRVKQC